MAGAVILQYGLYFTSQAEGQAAQAANGGSLVLVMSPEAALAFAVANGLATQQIVQEGAPYFSGVPGTVDLGNYPFGGENGTPGVNYTPEFVSTGTLTSAITVTMYNQFQGVMQSGSVNYTWSGTIIFNNPATLVATGPVPFTGKWQQQVLTYTGTGALQSIPTNFALNTGVVMVWVFPQATGTNVPCFRNSDMPGTISGNSYPPDATHGIVSFLSTGFTVLDNALNGIDINILGHVYTAIVLSDTTSDNRYMIAGSYPGTAFAVSTIPTLTTSFSIYPVTQLWIPSSGQTVFDSDLIATGESIGLTDAAVDITNMVTSLGTGQFAIGNSPYVNGVGTPMWYYTAFTIPIIGNAINSMFQTFSGEGNGSPLSIVLAFNPAFAMAADNVTTPATPASAWRGPVQTGTISHSFNGGVLASGGIEALGTDSVTIGTTVAPNAVATVGFALAGSGATPAAVPTYTPTPGSAPVLPPNPNLPPLNFIIGGGYSIQFLMERFESKIRPEEHL